MLVSAVTCLHLGGPDCCTPSFLVAYLSSYSGTLSDDDRLIRRYPLHYTTHVASSLYLAQTRFLSNIGPLNASEIHAVRMQLGACKHLYTAEGSKCDELDVCLVR